MFGVAEDHDSNPIKIGLGKMKARGAKIVSINPIRTGYSAIADEWIGLRPGTDGLFMLALVHELLHADAVDLDYLVRYTNAGWLIVQAPGQADHGLFARDADGDPLSYDQRAGGFAKAKAAEIAPAVVGEFTLADGRKAVPAFQLIADALSSTTPMRRRRSATACGIEADVIRRIAAEIADVAFNQAIELDIPWTDWAGRRA